MVIFKMNNFKMNNPPAEKLRKYIEKLEKKHNMNTYEVLGMIELGKKYYFNNRDDI